MFIFFKKKKKLVIAAILLENLILILLNFSQPLSFPFNSLSEELKVEKIKCF